MSVCVHRLGPCCQAFLSNLREHSVLRIVKGGVSLAADDEKVAWSNGWAGEVVLCLECFEWDAKPL